MRNYVHIFCLCLLYTEISNQSADVLSAKQHPVYDMAMDSISDSTVHNDRECCGYILVGDNLDKNFRPSHQRSDRQTRSVHIFHSCAIKNRVDVSSMSDKPAPAVLSDQLFLLNDKDVVEVLKDFKILISR